MLSDLKAGDIILTRSDTLLSRIIRWAGKKRTGAARVSHAAMALGDLVVPASCVESLWRVEVSPLSKYDGQEMIVWRLIDMTDEERERMAVRALTQCNMSYDVFKILLFLLDCLFRTYFFTRLFGISNYKVCSNLIAWAREKENGRKFGIGWRSVQPDTIDDWCRRNKKKAELVYSTLKGH